MGGTLTDRERRPRLALAALLVLGWLLAVWYMWEAMATLPSAERLETTRLVAIPTIRTFLSAVLFSALELAIVLGLLWPTWPQLYATRVAVAVLALVTWFILTTPMDLSRMDWVHRRWLVGMAAGLTLALVALLLLRAGRRLTGARQD